MKALFVLLLFFPIFLLAQKPEHTERYSYKLETKNKVQKALLEDFAYIKKGDFISQGSGYTTNENDSNLITRKAAVKSEVSSFFLSKFEITVHNYREFVQWAKDNQKQTFSGNTSTANDSVFMVFYSYLGENGQPINLLINPDTTAWMQDFQYSYNEPMERLYGWHPAYNEYPVVGVSHNQALAYCNWYQEQLSLNGLDGVIVRLPTEMEWEFAATAYSDIHTHRNSETREPVIRSSNKPYSGNFGMQLDQNGIVTKGYMDDGGFFTTKVDSYDQNYYGLHNMQGNVSEWTSSAYLDIDPYVDYSIYGLDGKYAAPITAELTLDGAEQKIHKDRVFYPQLKNLKGSEYGNEVKKIAKTVLHNAQVLAANKENKIVKGGSWAQPQVYTLIGSSEVLAPDEKHCYTGFRIAISANKEMLKNFKIKINEDLNAGN
ncbi:MAG: sulfatase activating formylglycine-generating enzyme [Parvicellaceae bacterium]|jgi:formylglycine-generating enzyme required for sulfatase activity